MRPPRTTIEQGGWLPTGGVRFREPGAPDTLLPHALHPMRPSFRCLASLILMLPAPACAQAGSGADVIAEGLIRRHVNVIADDSMLGRDTPSRGLDLTAAYVAGQFQRLGLKPAGDDGTFIQRYPVAGASHGAGGAGAAPGIPVALGNGSDGRTTPPAFDPNSAPNTVGIVVGIDPRLRDQYLVISAHMDHVGVSAGNDPDSIWNGADDDASGTAGVLALAEALARSPPKRSVILLTVSGEEKGLWGSRWFTDNPPVPLNRVVANLNLDMIGRNWRDTISVIGMEHSDLGRTLQATVAAHPALGLVAVGDLWPQENFFVRSDHYNFAKNGVPALFFFNGTHADYHRPSDSPDKIDAEKEARVVRLIYHTAMAVANAPARPEWNPESRRRIVLRRP